MKGVIVLFFMIGVIVGFLVVGLPLLKSHRAKDLPVEREEASTGKFRFMEFRITVEPVCKDIITGEIDPSCLNETGCDETCRTEGCRYFNTEFNSSRIEGSDCYCSCYENVYKKIIPRKT